MRSNLSSPCCFNQDPQVKSLFCRFDHSQSAFCLSSWRPFSVRPPVTVLWRVYKVQWIPSMAPGILRSEVCDVPSLLHYDVMYCNVLTNVWVKSRGQLETDWWQQYTHLVTNLPLESSKAAIGNHDQLCNGCTDVRLSILTGHLSQTLILAEFLPCKFKKWMGKGKQKAYREKQRNSSEQRDHNNVRTDSCFCLAAVQATKNTTWKVI